MTDNIKQFTGDIKTVDEILPEDRKPLMHYVCMARITEPNGNMIHMPDGCQGHATHMEATECAVASEELRANIAKKILADGAKSVTYYIMEQATTIRTVENLETFK